VVIVAGVSWVAMLSREDGVAGSIRAALLWAALGAAGFAVTFAFGQAASQGHDSIPAGLVTRIAALVVIGALIALQRPSMQPVRAHWRLLPVMGLLDTAALGLVMLAGGYPNAEFASVAASLFGVVTILLAWAVLGEKVRPPQWLGIGLVFGGITWLAL
jgi:drug/metabolite transporter (DMT)-like permease